MKMDGWVFIDKPRGITSFNVIQKLRKILNIKRIGHAGTLDPFATGILAVAIGEATKSIFFFRQHKTYEFNVIFGELKDTDDLTGKTIHKSVNIPTKNMIDECLNNFVGKQNQIPPKYSAVKINGERAYKLARKNKDFVIKPKNIFIKSLICLGQKSENEYSFRLECSTGTYVRSVARDLGSMLDTFAYVSELRRVKIGKFKEKDIILLEKFEELVHIGDHFDSVHSIREVLDDIPAVLVNNEISHKFRNGLSFECPNKQSDLDYLLVETKDEFVGIGKALEEKIIPVRVFNLKKDE